MKRTNYPGQRGRAARIAYQKAAARRRRAAARRRQLGNLRPGPATRIVAVKTKYVDGYLDIVAIHELSGSADDTWADCELNPSDNSGVYGCMPMPSVGDGDGYRDDRRIYVKKIKIRGYIRWEGEDAVTSQSGNQHVRLVFCCDEQSGGTQIQAETVLSGARGQDGNVCVSGTGGAINFMTTPGSWGKARILKDITFKCPPQPAFQDGTDGTINQMTTPFKLTIPINKYVNFSGNTGQIASIIDNSYHLFGAKAGSTGTASLSYYVRTVYIDA